jgi:hypothetical protein
MKKYKDEKLVEFKKSLDSETLINFEEQEKMAVKVHVRNSHKEDYPINLV